MRRFHLVLLALGFAVTVAGAAGAASPADPAPSSSALPSAVASAGPSQEALLRLQEVFKEAAERDGGCISMEPEPWFWPWVCILSGNDCCRAGCQANGFGNGSCSGTECECTLFES